MIAAAAGVTQARVSQVLLGTDRAGLSERTKSGWRIADPGAAFDLTTTTTAAAAIVTEGWYHLDGPAHQLELVIDCAGAAGASLRVCGDWAADLLAPWRIPVLAVVHCDRSLDLQGAGFVPAAVSDATLVVSIRGIRTAWQADGRVVAGMGGASAEGWPLAPVHEIAREIREVGGADGEQAVAELRQRFLSVRAGLEAASCPSR